MPRNIRTNVSKDYARLALFVYPENKEFLRGKRTRLVNSSSPAATLVALIFVVVALVLVGLAVFFGYRYFQLTGNSTTTAGALISHEIDWDPDGDSYYITYAYNASDQRMERRDSVGRGVYEDIVGGASFFVTYNISEPTVATIGEPSLVPLGISALFAVIFNLVSWTMLYGVLRASVLAAQLSERGLLLPGQVVRARGRIDDDDSDTDREAVRLELTYTFVSPMTKKNVQGKATNSRPELRGSQGQIGRVPGIFAPGDPLLVMYADDRRHTVL